jgi:DNA-binding NarL/FixJ family response regulator
VLRLLLVDDDSELLETLAPALASRGLGPIATCASASEAIAKLERGVELDVALIDLGLPDQSGVQVVRMVRALRPDAILLVFTVQDDAPSVFEALRAGARGYVLKSTRLERLVELIREAREGGTPISPQVAKFLFDALSSGAAGGVSEEDEQRVDALTNRERDVLKLLARGLSYAEVASVLGIGTGTVQVHVRHLYAKLEVASKAEAAALAAKLGWV